jgi:hypothetical protein
VLLVAAVLTGGLWAVGVRPPGGAVPAAVLDRLVCAARLGDGCSPDSPLARAYGDEIALEVRRHAPTLRYERGMTALPVDFRRCRSPECSDGPPSGVVWESRAGEPVTAFVHVVDCRDGADPGGAECGGPRAGNLYIQYWLYYPDSATLRGVPVAGPRGYHLDDWESYMVRIGPGGVDARASSHHGYNHRGGVRNWSSDAGVGTGLAEALGARDPGGWGRSHGTGYVSGGSHAGHAHEPPPLVRLRLDGLPPAERRAVKRGFAGLGLREAPPRRTPGARIILVPVETAMRGREGESFAVSPPWRKRVFSDPEYTGTD